MRAFAQRDFDLIIGIGFAQRDALRKVATQFPKKSFAIVDAEVDLPNVRSLLFEEHEGAFLVGAVTQALGVRAGFLVMGAGGFLSILVLAVWWRLRRRARQE